MPRMIGCMHSVSNVLWNWNQLASLHIAQLIIFLKLTPLPWELDFVAAIYRKLPYLSSSSALSEPPPTLQEISFQCFTSSGQQSLFACLRCHLPALLVEGSVPSF